VTLLSPFSFDEEVKIWEDAGLNPSRESTPVALKGVDLALTQPGTNTLELLYLKIPTLVAVPYVFLEDIPFGGLKRFTFRLPWVKNRLLKTFSENKKMLSWPNIIMGKELIPELVGDYAPRQIAEKMANYLCDNSWLKNISDLMSKFSSVQGASRRLTEEIIGCLP
jgi:lipid-A-disaccharide synthase